MVMQDIPSHFLHRRAMAKNCGQPCVVIFRFCPCFWGVTLLLCQFFNDFFKEMIY